MAWGYEPEVLAAARGIKAAMDASPPVEGVLVSYESAMRALHQNWNWKLRVLFVALYAPLGAGLAYGILRGRR